MLIMITAAAIGSLQATTYYITIFRLRLANSMPMQAVIQQYAYVLAVLHSDSVEGRSERLDHGEIM